MEWVTFAHTKNDPWPKDHMCQIYFWHLSFLECTDSSNNTYKYLERWKDNCNECFCNGDGLPACKPKKCVIDASHLPPLCEAVYGEGDKCCPDRIVCYEGKIMLGKIVMQNFGKVSIANLGGSSLVNDEILYMAQTCTGVLKPRVLQTSSPANLESSNLESKSRVTKVESDSQVMWAKSESRVTWVESESESDSGVT